MSECVACRAALAQVGGLQRLMAQLLGPRWWAADPASAQARVVEALGADGLCDKHAGRIGWVAGMMLHQEARRRSLVPGGLLVQYVEVLDDDPHEAMTRAEAQLAGQAVVEAARRFVARSPLAAAVEVDTRNRRARVTLIAPGTEPLLSMVLDSKRLVHTSAQEVFDGLRQRAAAE